MIRILIAALAAVGLLIAVCPLAAAAVDDNAENEVRSEIDEILEDYDVGWSYDDVSGMTFGDLKERMTETVKGRAAAPLKLLGIILGVTVFTGLTRSFGEGLFKESAKTYSAVCVLTAAAAIIPSIFSAYENALSSIRTTSEFMLAFVPVFAGVIVASGAIATGGGYSAFALGASGTFAALSESFLSPILGITAALAVSGSVFPESSVEGFTALIKKLTVWGMTFFVTLFTGFVTLKSNLAAKTDGAAAKTARFMISGFVPIVGSAVSDAYSTIKCSFELIGSTVGIAGCAAIAAITLPPIVEVFAYRAVLWIGEAAAQAFSAEPIAKLLKGIDDGLAIAQSVLVCYSVMLVICTAAAIQSLG